MRTWSGVSEARIDGKGKRSPYARVERRHRERGDCDWPEVALCARGEAAYAFLDIVSI